ncbi:hypothetical protein MAHJHV59_47850 [Mycobacterium avium subsp. hominissuis]
MPVDFGIGVSAGRVFAGNVGAENRYEYTVIGDAVNEEARLADLAKTADRRILCSPAASIAAAEHRILRSAVLARSACRAASFTASPITVYSYRFSAPTG